MARRWDRKFWPLCVLLGTTLVEEGAAAWLVIHKIPFIWIYHVYVVVEYAFLILYFTHILRSGFRKILLWSIPIFTIVSLSISAFYYDFDKLPGMNINISGVLITICCLLVIFQLDVRKYDSISKHPDFWICLGLVAFYVGTFFSNGLYTYLLTIDREMAKRLFSFVNKPLNIILYSCLIIGFFNAISEKRRLSFQ